MKIEFQEKGHIYTVDGKQRSSITQVIQDVCPQEFHCTDEELEVAANLGKAVHKITEVNDKGELEGYEYEKDVLDPYLFQWEEFKSLYLPACKAKGVGFLVVDIKTKQKIEYQDQMQIAWYHDYVKWGLISESFKILRKPWIEEKVFDMRSNICGTIDRVFPINPMMRNVEAIALLLAPNGFKPIRIETSYWLARLNPVIKVYHIKRGEM